MRRAARTGRLARPRGSPRPSDRRIRVHQDQGAGAFGMGRRIEHGHRSCRRPRQQHRVRDARGVEDGMEVIRPLFQGRQIVQGDGIRQARTPLVISHHGRERSEPVPEQTGLRGIFDILIRHPIGYEHDVVGTVPTNGVRQSGVAARGVPDVDFLHALHPPRRSPHRRDRHDYRAPAGRCHQHHEPISQNAPRSRQRSKTDVGAPGRIRTSDQRIRSPFRRIA